MKVSEVMTQDVWVCLPTEPLTRAAQIMWEQDCGCVPVLTGDGVPVGMVTDRDVCMAVLHAGGQLDQLPTGHAMSKTLVTCSGSDDLKSAQESMRTHRVRRLPVVDEAGALVGLLSLADVFRAASAQKTAAARTTLAKQLTETMGEISRMQSGEPAAELTPDEPKAASKKKAATKGKTTAKKKTVTKKTAKKKASPKKAAAKTPGRKEPGAEASA